ncbi:hypothetical protein Tco_1199437 [Tanacetum coccineum]
MCGAHLVAGDYRWGKNPLRDFPSEDSPATFRWGRFSPATRRWGKWQIFARENTDFTQTSWTDANLGHRFLGCPQVEGQRCIYFGWLDPHMCQRSMLIIPGLLRARNRIEADMMVLVQANMKLKKYLILSWVAFALFLLLS